MNKINKNVFLKTIICLSICTKFYTSQPSIAAAVTTTINNPENFFTVTTTKNNIVRSSNDHGFLDNGNNPNNCSHYSYSYCIANNSSHINDKQKKAIINDYARYQDRPVLKIDTAIFTSPNHENFHIFEERLLQSKKNALIPTSPTTGGNQTSAAIATTKKDNDTSTSQQETLSACLILAQQEAINDKKNGKLRDPQEVTALIVQRKTGLNLSEEDLQQIDTMYSKTYKNSN